MAQYKCFHELTICGRSKTWHKNQMSRRYPAVTGEIRYGDLWLRCRDKQNNLIIDKRETMVFNNDKRVPSGKIYFINDYITQNQLRNAFSYNDVGHHLTLFQDKKGISSMKPRQKSTLLLGWKAAVSEMLTPLASKHSKYRFSLLCSLLLWMVGWKRIDKKNKIHNRWIVTQIRKLFWLGIGQTWPISSPKHVNKCWVRLWREIRFFEKRFWILFQTIFQHLTASSHANFAEKSKNWTFSEMKCW